MSTKAIRELVERAKKDSAAIARSAVGWPDAGLMADKALLEVDAIERMAKMFHGEHVLNVMPRDAAEEAWALMCSIAKDAP